MIGKNVFVFLQGYRGRVYNIIVYGILGCVELYNSKSGRGPQHPRLKENHLLEYCCYFDKYIGLQTFIFRSGAPL